MEAEHQHYKCSNFKYTETSKISYNSVQFYPSVFNKRNCIFNSNFNLISAILKQFQSSEDKGSICDWNLLKKLQKILSEELVLPHITICSTDTDIYVCVIILRERASICHFSLLILNYTRHNLMHEKKVDCDIQSINPSGRRSRT